MIKADGKISVAISALININSERVSQINNTERKKREKQP